MFRVVVTAAAQKQLDELPRVVRNRFLRVVDELERWPEVSGAKPLRGDLAGRFRKRTGDYRVVFSIKGQTVLIELVGHRKDVYEE